MMDGPAAPRCQGFDFASLRVLDSDALLHRQVFKAAIPLFANKYWLYGCFHRCAKCPGLLHGQAVARAAACLFFSALVFRA